MIPGAFRGHEKDLGLNERRVWNVNCCHSDGDCPAFPAPPRAPFQRLAGGAEYKERLWITAE